MAQVEFTQTFTLALPMGSSVGNVVTLNGAALGTYIIKSLTCYSSTGLANTAPAYSVQIESLGALIWSDVSAAGAFVIDAILSPTRQMIITSPALTVNVNMTAAGNFFLVISYSFIPAANALIGNFGSTTASITATTGAPLVGASATQATIVKSIIVVNTDAANPTTITPLLNTVAFDAPTTIAAGVSYVYSEPLYINNTQTITITTSGAGVAAQVNYSYVQD
jgi:hypothetical protein